MIFLLDKLYNFINNSKYKLTIYDRGFHIINYDKLINIDDNYISFVADKKRIVIKGNNLLLKKILNKELLVEGIINSIEVNND